MERTHPQTSEPPDPAKPHPIVDEPATIDVCHQEYEDGAGARAVATKRQQLDRSKQGGQR
ncbi:hypothetical protein AB0K09_15175 [Streptomyces sp. NPDC049577]|uniref:hypothetical protein n=1 Tax=Streptomyces sp. NPDC049577 TaxID=3155153 RepID=UPI0034298DFD